eukprot:COSAG02_NODE_5602_length_4195_cov_3.045898_2_plen_785_part_00
MAAVLAPVDFPLVTARPAVNGSIHVSFHVEWPGIYHLNVSVQQHWDRSHSIELPVLILDVAPSAVDIDVPSSVVRVPTRVASHIYTGRDSRPTKVETVHLQTGPLQKTDYTIRFQVQLTDSYNNRVFGRDRVRLRICRGNMASRIDGGNFLLGPSLSTPGLYEADFRFSECQAEQTCDVSELGLGKNAGTAFGEFVLMAWVCPWQDADCREMESPSNGNMEAPCDEHSAHELPLEHFSDIMPQGDIRFVDLSTGADSPQGGMHFTVCPANSATSSGDWNGLAFGTGFVSGLNIDTCQCSPGYRGETGKECAACPRGKEKSAQGNTDCVDCAVGRYCACDPGPSTPCGLSGEAACIQCTACPQGRYMNSVGSSECEQCQTGFRCDRQGMTYPVALQSYYIDPTDPKEAFQCDLGEDACPGGDMDLFDKLADSQQPCTTAFGQLSSECMNATGAKCSPGYAAVVGAGCPKCCTDKMDRETSGCDGTKYYLKSGQCHLCAATPWWAMGAIVLFLVLIVAPSALKLANFFKRAGSLQAPIMSLINFMQSASLFRNLDLHWPPTFKKFCRNVAQLFMFQLPDLPFLQGLHPECAFTLTYQLKWVIAVTSPFLLLFVLVLAWICRRLVVITAKKIDSNLRSQTDEIDDDLIENPAAEIDAHPAVPDTETEPGNRKIRSCSKAMIWLAIVLVGAYTGVASFESYQSGSGPALYGCKSGSCDTTRVTVSTCVACLCATVCAYGIYDKLLRGSRRRLLDWCLGMDSEIEWSSVKHSKDTPVVRKKDGRRDDEN